MTQNRIVGEQAAERFLNQLPNNKTYKNCQEKENAMKDFSILEQAIRRTDLLRLMHHLHELEGQEFPSPDLMETPDCLKRLTERAHLLALYDEDLAKQLCPWFFGVPHDLVPSGLNQPFHSLSRTFAFVQEWRKCTEAAKTCWKEVLKDVSRSNPEICDEIRALSKDWKWVEDFCRNLINERAHHATKAIDRDVASQLGYRDSAEKILRATTCMAQG